MHLCRLYVFNDQRYKIVRMGDMRFRTRVEIDLLSMEKKDSPTIWSNYSGSDAIDGIHTRLLSLIL